MLSFLSLLRNAVSVSDFHKGGPASMFARAQEAPLIVLRNNAPIAVILSLDEYLRLTEGKER